MADNKLEFTTTARKREMVEFALDGDDYHFTPPKVSGLLLDMVATDADDPAAGLTVARTMLDWLSEGLPEEENARLVGRLRDPKDHLEFDDLQPVISVLVERAADRPTLPR
jgi:hypothetical protein